MFAKAATTTAFLNEGKANWRSKPATDKQIASLQRRIGCAIQIRSLPPCGRAAGPRRDGVPAPPPHRDGVPPRRPSRHRFKDKTLLRLALVHASAAPVGNNTGLAWLGDAALNLLAAEQLLTAPGGLAAMGELTQRRQLLVSRVNCEARAQQMGLGAYIILGKSILALGPSASVLAEGFEAVLGAVYIDGGMRAVRKIATASMDPPAPKPAAKRTKPAAKAEPASGAAPKQEAAASGSKAPAAKPAAARKAAAKSKPPAAKAKAKAKPASPATPKPRKRQAATPATAPPAAPVPQLSV